MGFCACGGSVGISAICNNSGAAGEHALDAEASPGSDAVARYIEEPVPAVIDGEEQLCQARNIHTAEYKAVCRSWAPSERRSRDARPVRALRSSILFSVTLK